MGNQIILENYKNQIRVAEAYVANNFDGKKVSNNTKLTTAVLLDNTNRWMSPQLNESIATIRSDLGAWKKFCLNLTNIAVPSLIANDLVIVHPMTSYSGSIAYLEYVSKTDKGGIEQGDIFNSVFYQGNIKKGTDKGDARARFTAETIVDTETLASVSGTDYDITPLWNPIKSVDKIRVTKADGTIKDYAIVAVGKEVADTSVSIEISPTNAKSFSIYFASGDTFFVTGSVLKYGYKYNQEVVPAEDIPTIGPVMRQIALVAEPRRIAVKYDQITAFQAKTDYGFSLDKQIAEQACGELAYEIDTDILDMLIDAAEEDSELVWSKALPVGVSKFEHYNGFLEIFEKAKKIIYKRTQKFHPNYMVISADILPVLTFVNGFKANNVTKMNGPYKVGSLNNVDVYVSPRMEDGKFFFGLNGNDMMSSAGVYAPYMAIVPTQLLGTPDGMLQQGFSTWYSKALLNTYTDDNGNEYSNLLVAGKITE